MIHYFWDEEEGGFFLYGRDSETLIARPKEIYDGATPSGNAVATMNMLRLARMTGNEELEEKAMSQFHTFGGSMKENPNAYTYFMMAFLFASMPTKEIVIAGNKNKEDTKAMIRAIHQRFLPFSTFIVNDGNPELYKLAPFAKNQEMLEHTATAYLCENFTCTPPTSNLEQFIKLLIDSSRL